MLDSIKIMHIRMLAEKEFNLFFENEGISFFHALRDFLENPDQNAAQAESIVGIIIITAITNPKLIFTTVLDIDLHNAKLLFKTALLSCLLDKIRQKSIVEGDLNWLQESIVAIKHSYVHPKRLELEFTWRPLMGYQPNLDIFFLLIILQLFHNFHEQKPNDKLIERLAFFILTSLAPVLANLAYSNFAINRNRLFPVGPQKCNELELQLERMASDVTFEISKTMKNKSQNRLALTKS